VKKLFADLALDLLDKKQPGLYNQAIMDFGAVVCKPISPLCKSCPFKKNCYAFKNNMVDKLPAKEKKIKIKNRQFHFIIPEYKNQVLIRQRTQKDIWQQLFEFPMIETGSSKSTKDVLPLAEKNGWMKKNKYSVTDISPWYSQQLSHQFIRARFLSVRLQQKTTINSEFRWVKKNELSQYAFPKVIKSYIEGGK
jgi:A/G-specific adenine glycosylase